MSDGVIFLVLLLTGIALSGWLGFCVGEDYGWRRCVEAYRRFIDEQREETS